MNDQNYVGPMLGVLDSDGATPVNPTADPTTHVLDVDDASTGSDAGGNTVRDGSHAPVLVAASESDGATPVALYVNSSGQLLIDSN